MQTRWALAVATIVLLVPGATASVGITAQIDGSRSEFSGTGLLEGDLRGWRTVDRPSVASDPAFRLSAAHLSVRAVVNDPTVRPGGGLPAFSGNPTPDNQDYASAFVEGERTRAGYTLRIFALPSSALPSAVNAGGCSEHASPTAREQYEPFIPGPDPERSPGFETRDSLEISSCASDRGWTVEGDFLVVLWEWDYQITVDGRTWTEMSGDTPSETPIDQPATFAWKRREVFMYVEDGHLALPAIPSTAWLREVDAQLSGTLTIDGTAGSISHPAGEVQLDRAPVVLEGVLSTRMTRTPSGLHHDVTGDVHSVTVANQRVALPDPSTGSAPWWMAAVVTIGLVGAAGWIAMRRMTRLPRAINLANQALAAIDRHEFDLGETLARRSLATMDTAKGRAALAVALTLTQRPREALEQREAVHERFTVGYEDWFGKNCWQAARTAILLHDWALARKWTDRLMDIDPDGLLDALNDPALAPLRSAYEMAGYV